MGDINKGVANTLARPKNIQKKIIIKMRWVKKGAIIEFQSVKVSFPGKNPISVSHLQQLN